MLGTAYIKLDQDARNIIFPKKRPQKMSSCEDIPPQVLSPPMEIQRQVKLLLGSPG